MISISAITNAGRQTVAVGSPVKGFFYNGQWCPLNFVLQEIERQGFLASIDISCEKLPNEVPVVRKTATLRVTFVRD